MTCESDLDEMITHGPTTDIFRAEEALGVIEVIGDNAEAVNKSTFAPTFVALQGYSIDQFVMAVTRLFDKPKQQYQLRSLPAIIAYVLAHAEELPIKEPVIFRKDLALAGVTISGLELLDDAPATRAAMEALRELLPTPETNPALDALKQLRDKRLAHPEHVAADTIPKTTWEPAEALIKTAQMIVGVLGAYTSTAYVDNDGDYFMSTDAQRGSMATRRLLRELGVGKQQGDEAS